MITTWLLIFMTWTPGMIVAPEKTIFDTEIECREALEERTAREFGAGREVEHMTGWCVDRLPETLEKKGPETKPEFLK